MATTAEDIKTTYPLPVYHFSVQIDGMDAVQFSEVSGLAMERQLITYKDGLSATKGNHYMPGQTGDTKLTLKRGIVKGGSDLYNWMASIQVTAVNKKSVTISLMNDEGDKPVVSWKVTNAFPLKLDAPSFNATSNEVAVESLDLAAQSVTVEYAK